VIEKIRATAIAVSLGRSEGIHSETETIITALSKGLFSGQARKVGLTVARFIGNSMKE
jgi:hypothetical protein